MTQLQRDRLAAIARRWVSAASPARDQPAVEWVEQFRSVGYTYLHLGLPGECPTRPLNLLRGAPEMYAAGMFWTPYLDVAQTFCAIHGGRIWAAHVQPWRLLAQTGPGTGLDGYSEIEFVVDTAGLVIASTECGMP